MRNRKYEKQHVPKGKAKNRVLFEREDVEANLVKLNLFIKKENKILEAFNQETVEVEQIEGDGFNEEVEMEEVEEDEVEDEESNLELYERFDGI